MKFSLNNQEMDKIKTGCLLLPVFNDLSLTASGKKIDKATNGYLKNILKKGDLVGEEGQTLLLIDPPLKNIERLLLVGCGKKEVKSEASFLQISTSAISALKSTMAQEACSCLFEMEVKSQTENWKIRQSLLIFQQLFYQFNELKTDEATKKNAKLKKFAFYCQQQKELVTALHEGEAILAGMHFARRLGNLPSNICTPKFMADEAKNLAKKYKNLQAEILNEKEIQKLKMGAILAVSQGSSQPPRFIILKYNGGSKISAPVVLVGKGVTFDTGGISLKPPAQMDEMKMDMMGAATILGTMQAIAELKLPINVIALTPCVENMPSGHAIKPGDIVTTMSGKTVEILNTDAEGRLILCDALTYAERFKPSVVVDVATLTGAMVIALGNHLSGIFSQDDELVQDIMTAGKDAGDLAWRMPLLDIYQDELKSPFADLANIGGRYGGSITAACYLSRFTKAYRWAHMDVAGTAMRSGDPKGATGRPVPLLTQFLINRSEHHGRTR